MTTFYVDYEGSAGSNDGSSFANRAPRSQSISSASYATGDHTIRLKASRGPTSIGNATWTQGSKTITLASALTYDIDTFASATWTVSANVSTQTVTANAKGGMGSGNFAVLAAFTTGTVAYKSFGSAIDLSAYNGLTFWYKSSSASYVNASLMNIELCSDTAGTTVVKSFTMPQIGLANNWIPVTLESATPLPSSVGSIRISLLVDNGAVTFNFANMMACKDLNSTNALSLNSLIGKNTAEETFMGIASINGTTVTLDVNTNMSTNAAQGYHGASETVTTYRVDPIGIPSAVTVSNAGTQWDMLSGQGSGTITISGGWDRTNMSTQTGDTWVDLRNGNGNGFVIDKHRTTLDRVHFVRCYNGASVSANTTDVTIGTMHCNNNSNNGFMTATPVTNLGVTRLVANYNAFNGVQTGTLIGAQITRIIACSNTGASSSGVIMSGPYVTAYSILASYNGQHGMSVASPTIKNFEGRNNVAAGVNATGNITGLTGVTSGNAYSFNMAANSTIQVRTANFTTSEATLVNGFSTGAAGESRLLQQNADNTTNFHRITFPGGQIQSHSGANRHTASGVSWEFSISGSQRNSVFTPIYFTMAKIAVTSGIAKTASVWVMRKGSTAINGRMFMQSDQMIGMSSDYVATASAAVDTWEQLSFSFTPTQTGVLEIWFQVWGPSSASNFVYVDDFSLV